MAVSNNFSASTLDLNGQVILSQPTALVWGPDGRLYVTESDGDVRVLSVAFGDKDPADADNTAQFYVTEATTLSLIKGAVQNHNDNGTENAGANRQVTGIDVTAQFDANGDPVLIDGRPAVTIYVTSSDNRIGAGGGGNDVNLDTNSGVITKMVQTGPDTWDAIDIVRGLPRSEENHATNGLEVIQEIDPVTGKLLSERMIVASGGNANNGAPSNNFAGQQEQPLSAAILEIDLDMLKMMPVLDDGGRAYVYDIPTLNDPARADVDGQDVNDPFGGNDGRNSAKLLEGGPISIYSPGYRNAYDVEVSEDGRVWTYDNGANNSWGGRPIGEAGDNGGAIDFAQALGYIATNLNNGEGNSSDDINLVQWNPSNKDNFHEVTRSDDLNGGVLSAGQGGAQTYQHDGLTYVYGGHPNPTRAEGSRAGLLFSPGAGTDNAFLLVSDQDSFGNGGGSDYDEVIAWLTEVENNNAAFPDDGIYGAGAGDLTKKVLAVTPGVLYDIYAFADGTGGVLQAGVSPNLNPPPGGTFLGQAGLPSDIAEIVAYTNPIEGDYREAGKTDGALDTGNGSINGLTEYTSTILDGGGVKMSGAIIAAQLNGGNLIIMGRNEDGTMSATTSGGFAVAADRTTFQTGAAPLGLASMGDDFIERGLTQPFQGSIWVASYGTTQPFIQILQPNNGAVPLAGSELVNPVDRDLDGVDYVNDPFEFSTTNGYAIAPGERIVIDFDPNNTNFPNTISSTGLLGAALDGVTPNRDAQTAAENFAPDQQFDGLYDIGGNILPGGNAPILQIKKVAAGTVVGAANTARDALHTGIRPSADTDRIVATVEAKNWILEKSGIVAAGQLTGMMFGDGTQANFLRFVFGSVNGEVGFEVGYEIGDANYQTLAQVAVPGLAAAGADTVELRFEVNLNTFAVTTGYRLAGQSGFTDIGLGGFVLPEGVLREVLTGDHTITDADGPVLPSGAAIGVLAENAAGETLEAIDFNAITIEAFGNEIVATDGAGVGQPGSANVDTVIYTGTDTALAPLDPTVENFDGRGSTADYAVTGNALDNEIRVGTGANVVTTGAGADVVRGTLAELAGDEITDFSTEDKVLIEGATLPNLDIDFGEGSAVVLLNGQSITFSGSGFENFQASDGPSTFVFGQTKDGVEIGLVQPETVLYRINAGSGGNSATNGSAGAGTITALDGGPDWIGDASLIGSTGPMSLTGATANVYTQALTDEQSEIESGNVDLGIVPWQLFVNERSDNTNDATKLTYNFAVEAGKTYKITIYYTENWNGIFNYAGKNGGNTRQFDVAVEGQSFSEFTDINPLSETVDLIGGPLPTGAQTSLHQEYLGVAFERSLTYTAADGVLTLEFEHDIQNPKVNAIQISALGGPVQPPADTTPPLIASISVENPLLVQDGPRTATVVLTDETGFDAGDFVGLTGAELVFSGIVPDAVSPPLVTLSDGGKTATLTYTLSAPGDAWPSGVGEIAIAAGAYGDAAGNDSAAAQADFVLEPNLANLVRGTLVRAINVGTTDTAPATNLGIDLVEGGTDNSRYGGAIAADSLITDAGGNPIAFETDDAAYYTSPKTNAQLNANVDGQSGTTGSNSGGVDLDGSAYHTYRDSGADTWTATYSGFENGTYVVELHFAELFQTAANTRVGDFHIQGQLVLDDFDVFAEAGGADRPISRTHNVTVTDGTITVTVDSSQGQAGYSAIAVYDAVPSGVPPTVSVGDVTVAEGADATLVFTRIGDLSEAVTVEYAVTPGSAGIGDYVAAATGQVTIPAGQGGVTLIIPTVDDDETEGSETFTVTITGVSAGAVIGDGSATVTISPSDSDLHIPAGGTIFELDFETAGSPLVEGGFDGALGGSGALDAAAPVSVSGGKLIVNTSDGDLSQSALTASKNDFVKAADLSDAALTEVYVTTRFDNPFTAAVLAANNVTNGVIPNYAQQGIVLATNGADAQDPDNFVKTIFGGNGGNAIQMWSQGAIDQTIQITAISGAAAAPFALADIAAIEMSLAIDKAAGTVAQIVTFFDASGGILGGVRPVATGGFLTAPALALPAPVAAALAAGTTVVGVTSTDFSGAGNAATFASFEATWDFLSVTSPQAMDGGDALVSIAAPAEIVEGGDDAATPLDFALTASDGLTGDLAITLAVDGVQSVETVAFVNGAATFTVLVPQDSRWNGTESVTVAILAVGTAGYAPDPSAAAATGEVTEDDPADVFAGVAIGDFSGERLAPTDVGTLELGESAITASQQGDAAPGGRDRDYITFTVAAGQALTHLYLDGYDSAETSPQAFMGLQAGTAVTVDPVTGAPDAADGLLAGIVYGPAPGADLLPILAAGDPADAQGADFPGFPLPLAAGTYTLWLNQGGPSTTLNLRLVTEALATTVTISDAAPVLEADGALLEFTLTASDDSLDGQTVTVTYDTADASGLTQDVLFTGTTGTLTTPVINDDVDDGDDTVTVTLTGASGGVLVDATPASGTVTEDDGIDPADIDGDGIPNAADPFAYDGTNGGGKVLAAGGSFRQDFDVATADPFSAEAGFSGILVNPAFNPPGTSQSDPYGDRTTEATTLIENGVLKIQSSETDLYATGTGASNTQKDSYHSAADVSGVDSFSVEGRIQNGFLGTIPLQYASFGITLGAGGTDDYVKFVIGGSGTTPRIQLANENSLAGPKEENIVLAAQTPPVIEEDIASVVFRLDVDKSGAVPTLTGTAILYDADGAEIATITTATRAITGSLAASLEGANPLTGGTGGVAYGVSITDWGNGDGNRFTGEWDYLEIFNSEAPGNLAPTADPIVVPTVDENAAPVSIDLLADANAADGDGGVLAVGPAVTVVDQGGDPVAFTLDGTTLSIDPALFAALDAGESATVTVSYDILDGQGGVTPNTATLTVEGVTDAVIPTVSIFGTPSAVESGDGGTSTTLVFDLAYTGGADETRLVTYVVNGGEERSVSVTFLGGAGALPVAVDNDDVDDGTDDVTVTLTGIGDNVTDMVDPAGATATGTVIEDDFAPVAVPDTPVTSQGAPLTFDPAANDTDADLAAGENLTVTAIDTAATTGGTVILNGDGTVTVTPDAGFAGEIAFGYTVSDAAGNHDAAGSVSVTVTGTSVSVSLGAPVVEGAPATATLTLSAASDQPITVSLALSGTGLDAATVGTAAAGGDIAFDAAGAATLDVVIPAGALSVDVTLLTFDDALDEADLETFAISITAANIGTAIDGAAEQVAFGAAATGGVLDNDAPVSANDLAPDGDLDGDGTPNSADDDVDGDGIPNVDDAFAYDAENGMTLAAGEERVFDFDIDGTIYQNGMTGFLQGTVNGGAFNEDTGAASVSGGLLTINPVTAGDTGSANNPQDDPQVGVKNGSFTAKALVVNPWAGAAPNPNSFDQLGLAIGLDSDDMIKLVFGQSAGVVEFQKQETTGSTTTATKYGGSGPNANVPLPAGVTLDTFAKAEIVLEVVSTGPTSATVTGSVNFLDAAGAVIATGSYGTAPIGGALAAALADPAIGVGVGFTQVDGGGAPGFVAQLDSLAITAAGAPAEDLDPPTAAITLTNPADATAPLLVSVALDDASGIDPATLGDEDLALSVGGSVVADPDITYLGFAAGVATYEIAASSAGWLDGQQIEVTLKAGEVADLAATPNTNAAASQDLTLDIGEPPVDPGNALEAFAAQDDLDISQTYGADVSGAAVLRIMQGVNSVASSNFGSNSFQVENIGGKKISAIFIDAGSALYPDSVFDPDGLGGDNASKPWAVNTDGIGTSATGAYVSGTGYFLPGVDPIPNSGGSGGASNGGYKGAMVKFNAGSSGGFQNGEIVGFSGDMDPNSIAGMDKSNALGVDTGAIQNWDVGGISGHELIGSLFTVLFDDGTTASGQLASDKSNAGSVAIASQSLSPSTVTLTVNGVGPGATGLYGGVTPSVIVTGDPGDSVRITLSKGLNPVTNDTNGIADLVRERLDRYDFKVNNAFDEQSVDVTIGSDGAFDASDLFDYGDAIGTGKGGFTGDDVAPIAFVASVIAPIGGGEFAPAGPVTAPIYLANQGGPVTGDPVDPPESGIDPAAPVITGIVDTAIVGNGETFAFDVAATDPNPGDTLTYSISGGADADLFKIDSGTGVVSFKNPASFTLGGDNVYDLVVTVSDPGGLTDTRAYAVTVIDNVPPTTLNIPIAASADDWEQRGGAGSLDLEFGLNGTPQTVGLRFVGITIPDGAVLQDAFIRLTALETSSGNANLIVGIENTENAAGYTSANAPQNRATVEDFVWNPEAWTAGQSYTLDVEDLVSGVIGLDGIEDGALSFIFRPGANPGSRVAEPFDGDGQEPELVLIFQDDTILG